MVDRYDDVVARIHGPSGKSVSYDDCAAMEAERDALAAQVEALEKDAGRWRFLLDNLQDLRGTAEMRIGKFAVMGRIDKYRIQEFKDADEFRQTIDAAREQKQ